LLFRNWYKIVKETFFAWLTNGGFHRRNRDLWNDNHARFRDKRTVLVQPELENECPRLKHSGRHAVRFLRHGGML